MIFPDDVIRAIIAAAYKIGADFGLFVELAAVTGGRASQLLRLQVGDLQDDGPTPRLMLPSSRKGRRRRIERRPLPIPSSLAAALRQIAGERPSDAPLLVRADGSPWRQLESRSVSVCGRDRRYLRPKCHSIRAQAFQHRPPNRRRCTDTRRCRPSRYFCGDAGENLLQTHHRRPGRCHYAARTARRHRVDAGRQRDRIGAQAVNDGITPEQWKLLHAARVAKGMAPFVGFYG